MIPCEECIQIMYPSDPRSKTGKYHLCGCDYCNKDEYYREIESVKQQVSSPVIVDNVSRREIDNLKGMLLNTREKLQAHLIPDKKRNPKKYTKYE